jgi:cytochrome c553
MRCIATSATLTSDSAEEAAEFAENLFGEKFTKENVIFGYIDPDYVPNSKHQFSIPAQNYLHPEFHQLLEEIRKLDSQTENIALQMAEMGLISSEMLDLAKGQEPSRFLWEMLIQCNDVNKLRQLLVNNSSPTSVLNVAEQFFDGKFSETSEKLQALYHLIELGAMARPEPNKPSLLPAKYHLFARPPHGIWVCVNPKCAGKQKKETGWSRIFASKRETCDLCGCSVYPLTICRTCGQTYLRMMEENGKFLPEVTDVYTVPAKRYLTWSPIYENRALAEIDDEEEIVASDETATVFDQEERNICLRCNSFVANCACGSETIPVSLQMVVKQEASKSKNTKPRTVPLSFMDECARCHDREFNDEEIAREISMATTNPLSIVTSELYRLLPEATQEEAKGKPGNGRKLLTFYDSRQGAARFAAFLSDIVNQEVYRNLIPTSASNLYRKKSVLARCARGQLGMCSIRLGRAYIS